MVYDGPLEELRLAGNLPERNTSRWPAGLRILDLALCNLTGKVPQLLAIRFPNLAILNASYNKLSGSIPMLPHSLEVLDISNTHVMGSIPKLPDYLRVLDISHTNGKGPIPKLPDTLQVLDISNNNMQESFMQESFIPKLPDSLQVLDISNSRMEENIASHAFLDSLKSLQRLNASYNKLYGFIPLLVATNLQVLDLSHHKLEGEIPKEIHRGLPKLRYINLSNNDDLTGPIPLGLPGCVVNDSSLFANNPGLCGGPLPSCNDRGDVRTLITTILTILIKVLIITLTFTTICLVLSILRWRDYSKQHQQDKDLIQILSKIGVGGFGTVYAGELADGTAVAIKRSKREGSPLDKQQFLNEVRILSQVNHNRLVKLLGSCWENKLHFWCLSISQMAPYKNIFKGNATGRSQGLLGCNAYRLLFIPLRLWTIYIQQPDILSFHRDVKSSNILLDHDLNAKVADFGISKLVPTGATPVTTLAIQGTVGYIDPEYSKNLQFTVKSDVYSFGAVLLELISAKGPGNLLNTYEDTTLVELAVSVRDKRDWENFVDPVLIETLNSVAGSMGLLAAHCLALKSRDRPDMEEVRQQLQTLFYMYSDACFDHLSICESHMSDDDKCTVSLQSPPSSEDGTDLKGSQIEMTNL